MTKQMNMTLEMTVADPSAYPLSSAQNRFWFMEHLESGITASNNPLDYRITGEIDLPLLKQSIRILVRRHESLRTVFRNGTGTPYQWVLEDVPIEIPVTDLSLESRERQVELIAIHSHANATHRFDFGKGPLFRCELLKLGDKEHLFLMNFHHIISDAVSISIFLDELKAIYSALLEKRDADLPPLALTYKEYARREKEWLDSDDYRTRLDYWKKELAGAPAQMNLPLDHSRPRVQRFLGDEFHFYIGRDLRQQIADFTRKNRTGLPAFLLSSFAAMLNRYSLQDDLVIGVPFANRNRSELLSLVGVMINTLPIRLSIDPAEPFSGLLGKVRNKFLQAFENMEVPIEKLVDELKVKRTPDINPVFQVLFNYLTAGHSQIELPGLTMEAQHGVRKFSQVDLTLTVLDEGTGLHCILQYSTDLFLRSTVERMSGHLLSILHAVTGHPDLAIGQIPLLTGEESSLILDEWNTTETPYPSDLCLHQLVERQAAATPDSIAVTDGNRQLTYRELNERANRLARFLAGQGAKEDTTVAVFLERTVDLVTTLLAVSKTGAAYLPLDPIFPKARLEMIVEDARPVLFISQVSLEEIIPSTEATIVLLDREPDWSREAAGNMNLGNPGKPAYLLYTSGSTGKPKGVSIRHHSVVNLVIAFSRLLKATPDDTLLAITTVSFDIAELEIYLPLITGGTLVVAPQEASTDMQMLAQIMHRHKVTLFQATPVTYRMLVQHEWKGGPGLKLLIGGEALGKDLARDLLPRCMELWNCYGPTETTIWSGVKRVTPADVSGTGSVSIGRPIANNTFYVLSPGMLPVPVGIPGELHIGGDGVSDGYLNLPGLTAERFLPDPFSSGTGKKIYRTGDLVKYLPDGNLVFLNRVDSQVKIRGFRIELGEIETVLSQAEGVKENVVVVSEDPSGGKTLVAYYTVKPGYTPDHSALRQALKARLPEYMIPSIYIHMEQLPLTGNNKIDRNALPKPETLSVSPSSHYVEPSTPTEKALAEIWESLLNNGKIGIHDDFFEAGGHSMVAVTMVRRIEKEFGVRLPLATLFERNTIHRLAEQIDEGAQDVQWRSLVPIRAEGRKKPLFLVHGMGLNVLLYTTVVNHLDPDQPVYGLQAKGLSGNEEPLKTIEEIAAYYISEIMTVDPEGPYALAGFSFGGRIAYEMARQLTAMGKQVGFLGLLDTTADNFYRELPGLKRLQKQILHVIRYLVWNLYSFLTNEHESKTSFLKRRWRGLLQKISGLDYRPRKEDLVSVGASHELPKYLKRVHRLNRLADRKYIVKPYSGSVHLFKARKQTFYIADPETYGWDQVAGGGVFIHEIPGEHSNTFAPPNDKFFAAVLQKTLNESL